MALLAAAGIAAVAAVAVVKHFEAGLPAVKDLRSGYHPSQVTRVLARDGSVLAELFTERRTVLPISDIPAHVKLAVLAAEDAGFYEHEGVNYLGIARAFVVNLRSGRTRQGGSTITQQVVKNLLLDSERSYRRKLREALLARRLEQELTKDEILELYLNHIYFGHGRYGVEEAARDNFGKSARDVTVGEAALLAGLVAGPESFSPRRDLPKALARRTFVLGQMRAKSFLDDTQLEAATKEPVHIAPPQDGESSLCPECVQLARKQLFDVEPERAALGGFTVRTTIDPKLQALARQAVRDNLRAYDKRHGLVAPFKAPATGKRAARGPKPFEGTPRYEAHKVLLGVVEATHDDTQTVDVRVGTVLGSLRLDAFARYNPKKLRASEVCEVGAVLRVSLLAPPSGDGPSARAPLRFEAGPQSAMAVVDVRTRELLALVGSDEGSPGALDRATQARRQPGSTFKPIVYSYALHSRRFTPATLVDVTPSEFRGGYRPTNYEGWSQSDPLRLREALANSVNVAAVRVLEDVGPANVVDWARALGVSSTLKPDLSLALGSYEVHPLELLGAYATFAAGGEYVEPTLVTQITAGDGAALALPPTPPPRRVLEPAEAYLITHMLESVVDHGTAQRARVLARPVAGKTGTSNDSRDAWFAGYSTELAAVVWVGYDDNKPLGRSEAGGSAALPAWIALMKGAHEGRVRAEFPRPAGVETARIDPLTGKLAPPDSEIAIEEVFLEGTVPTEVADPAAAPAALPSSPAPTAPPAPDGGADDEVPL